VLFFSVRNEEKNKEILKTISGAFLFVFGFTQFFLHLMVSIEKQ
jgi:hypothetical protein